MTVKFTPERVNIVELDGWSRWDPAGDISNWASDSAWDDWRHMEDSTCQEYVDDLVDASMGKRERQKVGPEELERICEYLKEEGWSGDLESTHHSITDALTWAWEEAYTPNDGDIQFAVEKAGDRWEFDFGEDWNLIAGEIRTPPKGAKGPKEWIPQTAEWSWGDIVEDLLKHVTYSRKPGWYDRYVTFDFGKAEPVKDLLEAAEEEKRRLEGEIKALDEELGRLGRTQQEEIRREEIEDGIKELQERIDGLDGLPDRLREEFRAWSDSWLGTFFKALEDVMEDAEPSNKFDVTRHWKSVLGDKRRMEDVRGELLEFLKKPAPERED